MIILNGKYNTAKIFTDNIDEDRRNSRNQRHFKTDL